MSYKRMQRGSAASGRSTASPNPELLETAEESGIMAGSYRRTAGPRSMDVIVSSLISGMDEDEVRSVNEGQANEFSFKVQGKEGGVFTGDDDEEYVVTVQKKRNYLRAYCCKYLPVVAMIVLVVAVGSFFISRVRGSTSSSENSGPHAGTAHKKIPPPLPEIHTYCSAEEIVESPMACEEACLPSLCCYASDSTNCYRYGDNSLVCEQYRKSCVLLGFPYGPSGGEATNEGGSEVELLDAPKSLGYWCSGADLESCRGVCESARCCLDSEASTCVSDLDTCFTYLDCTSVFPEFETLEDKINDIFVDTTAEEGVVPSAPTRLAMECEKADGDFPSLSVICYSLCLPASECCVAEEPEKNCYKDNVDVCEQYKPCEAIDGRYLDMGTPSD